MSSHLKQTTDNVIDLVIYMARHKLQQTSYTLQEQMLCFVMIVQLFIRRFNEFKLVTNAAAVFCLRSLDLIYEKLENNCCMSMMLGKGVKYVNTS